MRSKEEILEEYRILRQAYSDELAGIRDIYAFIDDLIEELDDCHNCMERGV